MEIGGYMELEHLPQHPWHSSVYELNLGRTALTFYLKSVGCRKLLLPYYLCDSVIDACRKADIPLEFYRIDQNLAPLLDRKPEKEEYLYIVNYYGQITNDQVLALKNAYGNIILDNTHAFYQPALKGVPTIYSVRKFFGVSDGAYLSCDEKLELPKEIDQSHNRMGHLLGRFERSASEYYQTMLDNAHAFTDAIPMQMSPLTKNILGAIDYEAVKKQRKKNYRYLSERLDNTNIMNHITPQVPYVYPLHVKNGADIRKKLAARNIYIPCNWSNVVKEQKSTSIEYDFAANILPLPCDQRYDRWAMEHLADSVLEILQEADMN